MLDTHGEVHLGYSRCNNIAMGGAMSKVFRRKREVIDLTKDDDEPQPVQQRPLPSYSDFKYSASPQPPPRTPKKTPSLPLSLPLEEPSPLTALALAIRPDLQDSTPQDANKDANRGPDVSAVYRRSAEASANIASQVSNQVSTQIRSSNPEVIDLVSPEPEHRRTATRATRAAPVPLRTTRAKDGDAEHPIVIPDSPPSSPARPAIYQTNIAPWNTLTLFSDGSFIEHCWGGAGVAFWTNGHWSGKAYALGFLPGGSYEAEARAMVEALKLAVEMLRQDHKLVEVCSDHSGLVKYMEGVARPRSHDQWVPKIIKLVNHLRRFGVLVKATWVKGHDIHAGNQMADLLAGIGSKRSAEGYGRNSVDSWLNPDVGEIRFSGAELSKLSDQAEKKASIQSVAKEPVRSTKEERRARKLQCRADLLGMMGVQQYYAQFPLPQFEQGY